ncbi:ectonucleoside triphosphate diphosphohydrolase 5 [Lepeophtheirus salmonis]|uniref:ectonucleoside triphosphate diphosphohydrolase 5 n=1 Tax=Lepeophtheirus salmonis TaxID=72036 RepID=UPI001AE98B55|nr:ectonucleoside triphosphate diphosphohydrolase 5-like [Lepeophtheirus salmonis]
MNNNMELRQRRPHVSNSCSGFVDGDERVTNAQRIDRRFTILILSFVLFVFLGWGSFQFAPELLPHQVHESVDQVFNYMGVDQRVYAIVIDAGSTGTRILVFSFHHNLISGNYILEDQLFVQKVPGISAFAHEPETAAQSVNDLLQHAYDRIPLYKRQHTPIALKATAGLRLLSSNHAQVLISSVSNVLESSDFRSIGAEIMNPMEEGLYGWFTLNYLMQSLDSTHSDFVCMDLGGGSTQITFSPSSPLESLIEPWMKKSQFIHRVSVVQEELDLYSHSYLGLGIMSLRKAVFVNASQSEIVSNPCIGRNVKAFHHTFQDFNYTLIGDQSVANPYETCLGIIQNIVSNFKVHRPQEIKERKIAAFSYFFDRALDRNLIPEGSTEGIVRVKDFVRTAKIACNEERDIHKFHCLDFTYISSLFKDGYGFLETKEIHLFKKVDGYDVSWALGVAYSLLEKNM